MQLQICEDIWDVQNLLTFELESSGYFGDNSAKIVISKNLVMSGP